MKHRPMTREERAAEDPQERKETIRRINELMRELDLRQLQRLEWNARKIR